MKILVVLGAGASHDVYYGGVPEPNREWQPPLAAGLFNLKTTRYKVFAERFPGTLVIAEKLAARARILANKFDLEAELLSFARHKSATTKRWFVDVPCYLSDLIREIGRLYDVGGGCYAHLVDAILNEHGHEVAFVVMNYDTLLEGVLSRFFGWRFSDLDDYVLANPGPVVKLHGSANWFVGLGDVSQNWEARLAKLDPTVRMDANLVVNGNDLHNTVTDLRRENGWVYPVLTAPMAGKDPGHRVCPDGHVEVLRRWGKGCHKLLVIGCSAKDANLLQVLDECLGYPVMMQVVGGGDVKQTVARLVNGVGKLRRPHSVMEYEHGFRNYVDSGHLDSFLRESDLADSPCL